MTSQKKDWCALRVVCVVISPVNTTSPPQNTSRRIGIMVVGRTPVTVKLERVPVFNLNLPIRGEAEPVAPCKEPPVGYVFNPFQQPHKSFLHDVAFPVQKPAIPWWFWMSSYFHPWLQRRLKSVCASSAQTNLIQEEHGKKLNTLPQPGTEADGTDDINDNDSQTQAVDIFIGRL